MERSEMYSKLTQLADDKDISRVEALKIGSNYLVQRGGGAELADEAIACVDGYVDELQQAEKVRQLFRLLDDCEPFTLGGHKRIEADIAIAEHVVYEYFGFESNDEKLDDLLDRFSKAHQPGESRQGQTDVRMEIKNYYLEVVRRVGLG
jgi:hypothetical protein